MLNVNNAALNYKCSLQQEGASSPNHIYVWLSEAVKTADKGHYYGAQKEENIYLVIGSDKQNIEIGTPCAKYNPILLHL